jgi:metal-responsive CopG/Arc/MetJ family transcriptional regulator
MPYIPIYFPAMPAKRVLISIDERVLARIDEAVQRSGQTRSGFLAQAAIAQIEGGAQSAQPRSKDALGALDDLSTRGR